MTERFATTPFGGGRLSAPIFLQREKVEARRQELRGQGARSNDTGKADKWRLLRALTEARASFGLSDRSIAVLEALAGCWQGKELDGAQELIVFPSNHELSLRARGMAPATIRRHLAALVAAGMILRRDSANGKRFCRRGAHGEVAEAFGFDLAPFAQQASAIFAAAEAARSEALHIQKLRSEITIHLRDIAKVISAGLTEGREGAWETFLARLGAVGGYTPRNALAGFLSARRDVLVRLRAEVETAYLNSLDLQEMSANDSGFERHHQNSNTEPHFEKTIEKEKKPKSPDTAQHETSHVDSNAETTPDRWPADVKPPAVAPRPIFEQKSVPLGLERFKVACPQIAEYSSHGLRNWLDVIATASLVRSMLGISSDAWERAREIMGDAAAAVTVAAILERADTIKSAGGYLRALTDRAEDGKFSVLPMIAALENR